MCPPALPSDSTCALIQEVGQQAAHDSLVGDDEDVALTLQLHDDRLQPLHQVLVRLGGGVGQAGRRPGTSWQPRRRLGMPGPVAGPLLPQLASLLEVWRLHAACQLPPGFSRATFKPKKLQVEQRNPIQSGFFLPADSQTECKATGLLGASWTPAILLYLFVYVCLMHP